MRLTNISLFACAAFAAGIWQAQAYYWHFAMLAILALLLLLVSLWRVYSNYQRSFWPIITLFFIAGMLCYNQSVLIREDDISHYVGQSVTLEGIVDAVPEITNIDETRLVRYVLATQKLKQSNKDAGIFVSGKIRVTVRDKDIPNQPAGYGDTIRIYGKVLELHGYNNPGQIDITAAFKRQGITARMTAQEQTLQILAKAQDDSWRTTLADWRQIIISALQKVMPANDAAILTAVLFGGYQGISKEVIQDFTATGLIHILSVSGAHIALVVGLVTWIGKFLRWHFAVTVFLAVVVVSFYAYMSGLTPPVIRSAIMGLISLLAVMLKREAYAPAALAITMLLMLVYQPLLLFDISFQLSCGATAGLVFLYQKTQDYLSRYVPKLAGPLAVTLAAQLGVLPVIAWYFNNLSLIAFAANIIVLPIIELVIILGLIGVSGYTIFPLGSNIIFVISSLLLGVALLLTKLLSAVPHSSVYIPTVGLNVSILYYVGLAWLYGWRPFHLPGFKQLMTAWPRATRFAILVFVACLAIYWWYPRPLTVHFIDVGQGDATLIITPHGKVVLVDAGGVMGDTNFDIGERVVAPYLRHYGVHTIDYLILTHGHQDHAGGAAGTAGIFKIANVILPQEAVSPAVQALLHTLRQTTVIPAYEGLSFQIDKVSISIEQPAIEQANSSRSAGGNENSSVVRVNYGQHSFLLTGDLSAQGETALLTTKLAPCTVLKVGHHGARTSTTEPFLQAVSPIFAVISAGYNNQFGHPHSETLTRLAKYQAAVYRTDKQGAILFTSDGKHIEVDTYVK